MAPPIRTLLMQLVRFQKSKVVEYKHNVLLKSCLPVQICTNATNGAVVAYDLYFTAKLQSDVNRIYTQTAA